MVDANLLRERGREAKLKKKRFQLKNPHMREGARSEVSMYTPETKTGMTHGHNMITQTDLTLPVSFKARNISLPIDSSDRTRRASTRVLGNDYLDAKEFNLLNKALKDLTLSGTIPLQIQELLRNGFSE